MWDLPRWGIKLRPLHWLAGGFLTTGPEKSLTGGISLVVQWLNYFIIWINYALLILYWWTFRVSLIFSYEDFHNQPGFLYIKDQVGRFLRHGQLDLNCLLPVAVCRGESVSTPWKCASVPFPASCPTFTLNVLCLVTKSCPTLGDPMDCSAPGSSVHGILQARTPEWVAMPSSRGSSWPRDWTCVSGYLLHWQAGSLLMHHLGNLSPHSTQRDYKHEWWRFIFLKITHQQSSSRDFCPVWRECILELTVEPSFPLISLSP